MPFPLSLRRNLRRRGDSFRDAGQWSKAEAAYRAHLVREPDDAAIYVQFGHALKQQGKLLEAADAYREGVRRLGENADALIHLGDALVGLGRFRDATEIYRRSYEVGPDERVLRRLTLLTEPGDMPDTRVLGAGSHVFAVQDLFGYLRAHPTLSGIQRVQAAIILHSIDELAEDAHFVLSAPESRADILLPGEYWRIDQTMLRSIVLQGTTDAIDHAELRMLLIRCEASAVRVRPTAGSTIIVLGAFWSYGNTVDRFLASQREGARLGFYVYDLIPLTHEAFCEASLVRSFSIALAGMAAVADFVLTISCFTQESLLAYLTEAGGRALAVVTIPLARCAPGGVTESRRPAVFDQIGDRPYVVYVSTIEGRKNHLYAVRAWQHLVASGLDVPTLLFVGRMGWQIDALNETLRSTAWLQDRILHAQDLSDAELNAVYAGSLFTVFPSFVEGWGLPVGESLSHGRPCVASRIASISEIGGDLVDYVDPDDLEEGIAVLRRMILDGEYRAMRSAKIAREFVERSWSDVGRDFVSAVRALAREPRVPYRLPDLPQGQSIALDEASMGRFALANDIGEPIELLFDAFYPPQREGMWMRGLRGRLRVTGRCAPGEPFVVALKLIVAPWSLDGQIDVSSASPDTGVPPLTLSVGDLDRSGWVTWETCADDRGLVEIELGWDGPLAGPPDDPRRFAIGLGAIACMGGDDARLLSSIVAAATS